MKSELGLENTAMNFIVGFHAVVVLKMIGWLDRPASGGASNMCVVQDPPCQCFCGNNLVLEYLWGDRRQARHKTIQCYLLNGCAALGRVKSSSSHLSRSSSERGAEAAWFYRTFSWTISTFNGLD